MDPLRDCSDWAVMANNGAREGASQSPPMEEELRTQRQRRRRRFTKGQCEQMMSSSTPFSSTTPFSSSLSSSAAFPVDLLSHQLTQPQHHQQIHQESQPQPLQVQQPHQLPHHPLQQVQFGHGGSIGHGGSSASTMVDHSSSTAPVASISGRRNSVIVHGAFGQQQIDGNGTNPVVAVARGQGGQSGGKRGAKRRRKGGEEGGSQSQSQGQANGHIHGQALGRSQGQIHGQALGPGLGQNNGQIHGQGLGQVSDQAFGQASGQLSSLGQSQGDELKVPPHQKQLLLAIGLKRALTPEVLGVNRFISPFSPEAKIPLPHELNELSAHGTTVWKRNERERHRVREVNNGYAQLRGQLPLTEQDRRLSKVDTLRMAIVYIRHLELLLDHGLGHQRECQCFSAANFPNSEPGSSAENTPSPLAS